MRVRHRIPSIFNLSMVDVLCCALGCVILLWLINLREADEHQRNQSTLLEQTTTERNEASARLHDLEEERAAIRRQLASESAATRELERNLRGARSRLAALEDDLSASTRRSATQLARIDELAKKQALADARAKQLGAAAATVPALLRDLKEARARLGEESAMARALEKEVSKKTEEMTALEKAMAGRALDLATSNRLVEALEKEKDALRNRALRLQAEADSRFAGIALTGRRAVFLVDMSGSMEHVDPNTPAPAKWLEVRNTMARIMRSLQDLEKFQLILFSTEVSWPLGKEGEWLDFDPKTSIDRAVAALAAVRPEGGTHMYAGLEAAFSLRTGGLDTVYLLSDGLPNNGPGLTADQRRRLRGREHEVELGNLLGRHILKTLKTTWNREGKIRINSIGFFYESPDVGAFLWALSRAQRGQFCGHEQSLSWKGVGHDPDRQTHA